MAVSPRRLNVEQIIAQLRAGPVSRAELGARTGLSRATVSSIVGELIDTGVAVDRASGEPRRVGAGRPTRLVALSENRVRSLGVAFRKAGVSVAIADPLQHITGTAEHAHRPGLNWRARAELAAAEIDRLYAAHHVEPAALDGIGIGVTGPVPLHDPAAPWRIAVDELGRRFDAPVHVDNNLRLAALAEAGRAGARGSLLYFHLAEGIGAGIVLDGRLYRGSTGAAGELGHVRIRDGGPACICGSSGCLEQYAALPAVLRRAGVRRGGRDLRTLAADPALAGALADAAAACGRVAGDALTTLDIDRVVLGGILAYAGDAVADAFTGAVRDHLLPSMREALRVTRSAFHDGEHDDAAVLGGIALVHHNSPALEGYRPYRTTPQSPEDHS